jgi:outer membrane protein insertion porin family
LKHYLNLRFSLCLAILLISLGACTDLAIAQQRVRILGLSVEGNTTTDAGLIRAHSGLTVGKDITGDDIQTAVKQLWKLNLFSDVQIVEDEVVADGVYVMIKVAEYPRLERLEIKGNRKLKGEDLTALLQLTEGQVVRPFDLVRLENRLRSKYTEMGYLLAEIEMQQFTSEETSRQVVEVNIREGKKVKVRRVEFIGNSAFSDNKLRGRIKTRKKSFFRSGEYKLEKIEEDKDRLITYYQSHGYRDIEIVRDSVSYTENKKGIHLAFFVNEGPVYSYGNVTWNGNLLFKTEALESRLRIKTGETYDRSKFDVSLADIGSMYYDRGYIYASVVPAEKVRDGNIVDIEMQITEGSEFKVNQIFIEGNTKTKEKVVRRELVLYPGETFDVSKLRRSIREVTILNYFANVTPDVVPINDNQVDLYLNVEEKSTDQANVSAGYSQRDKFIGSVGFQMNNLMGNGQQFAMDWNFGQIYRSFSVSFTEPWFRNRRTLVGVSFFDTHRGGDYYGFDEDIIGGSLRVGRRLKWPDDYFRLDYIYRLDRTKYSHFSDSFKADNPRELQEDVARIASSVSQIISRDSRDEPEFPTTGSVNSLRTELTGGPLGGDDQFLKGELSNRWFIPVIGKLVMVSETNMGVLEQLRNEQSVIPYFDYFFMGGSGLSLGTSLRGYDERDVGPQSGSFAIGGKTLFKQSFELRYPIVRNPTIFALTFTEAGNVWKSFEDTNPMDLRRSVGFGVRLFMPFIGMIGFDMGYGLDYPNSDGRGLYHGNWQQHFQFGRSF